MKTVFLIFLMLVSTLSFAQKEGQELADSLIAILPTIKSDTAKVNVLNELAFTYQNIDPDIGKNYGYQALNLAKKSNWKDGIAVAYKNIGINHSVLGNFESALNFYEKAQDANPRPRILTKILLSTGLVYTYQSNYPKALEHNMRALKISEGLGDRKSTAAVLSNTGIIYYDLANYPKAIEFYTKALKINREMGNEAYMSINLGNLGNVYSDLGEFDKSIRYKKEAIALNDQLGDKVNKAINLGSIAYSYFQQKDFDRALEYAQASLEIEKETENDRNIPNNLGLMGDIYLEYAKNATAKYDANRMLDLAIANFKKALKIQTELNNWKEIAFNYGQLSESEKLKGNYVKALDYVASAQIFKDSVYNETSKETIKNLEDQRTIELRDKEIEFNKLTIENKEKQRWYLLGGIILLLILIGMALLQSRNRKRTNKKLQLLNLELDQANKIKTRFFSILNHDLRSPVSNLIQFLHLQKNNPEMLTPESSAEFENKAIASAENLLDSMEDILLWSKGQMENFQPQFHPVSIANVFQDLEKHFSDTDIRIHFEDAANLRLNTDSDYLKTIMRNLTSNAIKVLEKSANPAIFWKTWKEGEYKMLSISDNGPGGSLEKFRALYDDKEVVGITTGLGLHLIRDLAKAINCKISVDSTTSGTTFTLIFP